MNKFLAGFELDGGSFSGYRRLFSNGDIDGFDFQWGGRLYGVGDYSYQTIKKTERQKMTIGGEDVVEIDINASYLTILHGIEGYPLPNRDDLCSIGGYDRTIVEAWITATIGTMLKLMHSYCIPCFSVHDSIIVRKSDQQIAMETLKDQFLRRTNIEPRLKVN